ncbi:MAG: DnaD domain protein [Bacilli bacterium]|nr:DnaD domain protein [Bacilli bacterium]
MHNDFREALDYNFLLVEYYKKLKINEQEAMTIIVIDHLLKQGNKFITADLLSLKMSLSVKEIDKILVSLLSKSIISYEDDENGMMTTLNPLYKKLKKEFENNVIKRREDESTKDYNEQFNLLSNEFKNFFSRNLSPLEIEKIKEWISLGYNSELILDCLREALNQNKKTIRHVDKLIQQHIARQDMNNEGFSTISDVWANDVGQSFDIAAKKWKE